MSISKEKDLLPLLVTLESIGKIEIYASGFNNAIDFFQHDDQVKFNASLLLLINIGEQSGKLSDDLKIKYPNLPFSEIKGLRNRIAHDYTGIDYEMVYDIIIKDIPAIKSKLIFLLKCELSLGTFDLGELYAAKQSLFYKHIDFSQLISR